MVIRRIAEATRLSMTYAAAIRSGREVPHRRHWSALLELAQEEDPQRELKEKFSDVDFHEDIVPKLERLGWTHRKIADEANLSRSYVSDVMRGETTPSLEYWKNFSRVANQSS